MNLLLDALTKEVGEIIKRRKLSDRAHVATKTNTKGRLVVAIVMDETYPGEFAPRTSSRSSR